MTDDYRRSNESLRVRHCQHLLARPFPFRKGGGDALAGVKHVTSRVGCHHSFRGVLEFSSFITWVPLFLQAYGDSGFFLYKCDDKMKTKILTSFLFILSVDARSHRFHLLYQYRHTTGHLLWIINSTRSPTCSITQTPKTCPKFTLQRTSKERGKY